MKLTFLWAIVLALLAAPAAATTLSFAAPPAAVHAGDSFTLNVLVADATDLYGFQFDVAFDPVIVQVNRILEGDFLAAGGATSFVPGTIDNIAGTVTFMASTLLGPGPGAAGDGVVGHLVFQALTAGQSELSFGNVLLLDSALAELDTTAVAGAIDVSDPGHLPEPASAGLVGLALLVLTAGGRRRMHHPDRLR